MAVCKNCNSELPEGAKFCMKCGTKVETELFCPQCGTKVPAGAAFCMNCGTKIGAAEAAGGVSEEKKPEPKAAVQGDKIVVSPDGSTGYSSIQAAVDAASDGMMIEIMPGTYKENIEIGDFNTKKHIALVGIADDSGKFPTITAAEKGKTLIYICGNVNLYRLNIETGVTQQSTPEAIEAVYASSDSFVYSELNFDGMISVTSISDDFGEDCEISNCTITRKIHDDENDCEASGLSVSCRNYETTPTFVKVRDCNFEKGRFLLGICDTENCTIGVASVCGETFLCKNSTIKDSTRLEEYLEDSDWDRFVDCKFLDK